jgi:hypothetical protein
VVAASAGSLHGPPLRGQDGGVMRRQPVRLGGVGHHHADRAVGDGRGGRGGRRLVPTGRRGGGGGGRRGVAASPLTVGRVPMATRAIAATTKRTRTTKARTGAIPQPGYRPPPEPPPRTTVIGVRRFRGHRGPACRAYCPDASLSPHRRQVRDTAPYADPSARRGSTRPAELPDRVERCSDRWEGCLRWRPAPARLRRGWRAQRRKESGGRARTRRRPGGP